MRAQPQHLVVEIGDDGSLRRLDEANGNGLDDRDRRVRDKIDALLSGTGDMADSVSLTDIETLLLQRAVDHAGGNLSAAARVLGISRPTLEHRIKTRAREADATDRL